MTKAYGVKNLIKYDYSLLINAVFVYVVSDNIEQHCIPITEILASAYIRHKKRGHSDLRIFEITGYNY